MRVRLFSRGASASISKRLHHLLVPSFAWRGLSIVHGFSTFRQYCSQSSAPCSTLTNRLIEKMNTHGPIPVSEYMKECLTDPRGGYYMHRDVFGEKGDFITSPEISQMFGEIVGVWFVNEWQQMGEPDAVQLVELGPGRGTLSADILRVFAKFPKLAQAMSLSIVEVSPELSNVQHKLLCGSAKLSTGASEMETCRFSSVSTHGLPVTWYSNVEDVPKSMSFFLAHEFLDALPVQIFKLVSDEWRGVLVGVAQEEEQASADQFKAVLSPKRIDESSSCYQWLLKKGALGHEHVEIIPDIAPVMKEITSRIRKHGGSALIADYGHLGEKQDTFRGFKNHKVCSPFLEPGSCDLTADVDFSFLSEVVGAEGGKFFGPVTQEYFLKGMGISVRLQVLLQAAYKLGRKEVVRDLLSGFEMITSPQQMGHRFKFFCVTSKDNYTPPGFSSALDKVS